jgi:hypothetical protein
MDTMMRFLRSVTGAEFSDRRRNEDTSRELHIVELTVKQHYRQNRKNHTHRT